MPGGKDPRLLLQTNVFHSFQSFIIWLCLYVSMFTLTHRWTDYISLVRGRRQRGLTQHVFGPLNMIYQVCLQGISSYYNQLSLGLKEELVRVQWSKVKGHRDLILLWMKYVSYTTQGRYFPPLIFSILLWHVTGFRLKQIINWVKLASAHFEWAHGSLTPPPDLQTRPQPVCLSVWWHFWQKAEDVTDKKCCPTVKRSFDTTHVY